MDHLIDYREVAEIFATTPWLAECWLSKLSITAHGWIRRNRSFYEIDDRTAALNYQRSVDDPRRAFHPGQA